ncbi:MAG: phosphonate ABC transporter ATP-binding protein [Acidobacteriota bacterium]
MQAEGASFRLAGVSVAFGETAALREVDLAVAAGEAVGFVGPSGSGKTTLLRLLNGTVRPSSGSVAVDGEDLASLPPARLRRLRSHIGTIHQDLSLVPNLRVLRNVLAGRLGRMSLLASLRLLFLPPRAEVHRVHRLLERVGISEKLYERTDRLSGGQRQRVAIARALYQEPRVLLPDEPISSLDPARSRDTMRLLVELSREAGITLCMSLHDLEAAREFLPRLVGLRRGTIVFDRPSAELADADFHQLYDLTSEEMLDDGA